MGLRDALRSAAEAAVAAVGDVAVSADYLSHSSSSYNASTGSLTATFATVAGVKMVFDEFRISEIDGVAVRPNDKKALVPAASLSGVTPGVEDQIVHAGETWEVLGVRADPAGALYELQVRRP